MLTKIFGTHYQVFSINIWIRSYLFLLSVDMSKQVHGNNSGLVSSWNMFFCILVYLLVLYKGFL